MSDTLGLLGGAQIHEVSGRSVGDVQILSTRVFHTEINRKFGWDYLIARSDGVVLCQPAEVATSSTGKQPPTVQIGGNGVTMS